MSQSDFDRIELLAGIDALLASLRRWCNGAPDWPPAQQCAVLVGRLNERLDALRVRLDAPVVVGMFGGTGTGKSALVNAIVGEEVTQAGRERPTTLGPTLVCHRDYRASDLLISAPAQITTVTRDLPMLRDIALLDCPDPDTADATAGNSTWHCNLLANCDVLLVTTTQQKYRSACILDELIRAAPGARLIFVQTHADSSDDIRADWRSALGSAYRTSHIFYVDSVKSLGELQAGLQPRGDFGRLLELLTGELASTAANQVRRANVIDLAEQTVLHCRRMLVAKLPAIETLETALVEQRMRFAECYGQMLREELLTSRRQWEQLLLADVSCRWGFSPFSIVLRAFQGFGGIMSSMILMRARTPAQVALWGAFETGRTYRRHRQRRRIGAETARAAAAALGQDDLRTAAIIVDGYASEAGISTGGLDNERLRKELEAAIAPFVSTATTELQKSVSRLASRHTGWLTRCWYEILLGLMLSMVLLRMAKNFFWDSWLAQQTTPVLGFDFLVAAGTWLLLWCTLLIWAFTRRLQRGLNAEINAIVERCVASVASADIFATVGRRCQEITEFRHQLDQIEAGIIAAKASLDVREESFGHLIT